MRATILATLAALLVLVLSMVVNAGCGGGGKGGGDMAMAPGADMAEPDCVMNPQTATEILNACSEVQTGEASKDAPYFPSLAPGGMLPPLP